MSCKYHSRSSKAGTRGELTVSFVLCEIPSRCVEVASLSRRQDLWRFWHRRSSDADREQLSKIEVSFVS